MIAGNLELKGNHTCQQSSGAFTARVLRAVASHARASETSCSDRCYGSLIVVIDDIRKRGAAQNDTGACHARVALFIVRGVHKVERKHLRGLEPHTACSVLS